MRVAATATDEAAQTIHDNATSARQQSALQAQQVTLIATALNEVTYSIQDVANHAQASAKEASAAESQALDGLKNVELTLREIDGLSTLINSGVETINAVAQQSERISSVLAIVRAIAEQTNLLALNAAIEAARAGEHGRGFAVVADEVRGLASRTRASTGEIDGMIQRLGQVTRDAAASLEDSQRLTGEGVELTARASEVLAAITTSIVEVENAGRHIAEAARTQHHLAGRVDGAAGEVERVVEQNAEDCARLEEACGSLQRLSASLGQALGAFRRGA